MSLKTIKGIGPATEEKIEAAGITTVEQLADGNAASLAEKTAVSEGQLEEFIDQARTTSKASEDKSESESPSQLIDTRIEELPDWQGEVLSRIRGLIKEADPDVVEEVKWRKPTNPNGIPVWSHDGTICTGETYKNKVKLTFAKGASLEDPAGLFNASLNANVSRAIDIHEGDEIDEKAFKSLIRAAAA
jgi:hypothetical protein